MVLLEHPRGEEALRGIDQPGPGRTVVGVHGDFRSRGLDGRKVPYLLEGRFPGFPVGQPTVNGDGAPVRHGASRRGTEKDFGNRQAALAQERIVMEVFMKCPEFLQNGGHLVNGVVPPFRSGSVAGKPLCAHPDLHAPPVSPVDVARRGLREHHELWTVPVLVDDVLPAEAVAVLLLDRPRHHEGEIAGEAEVLYDFARIDHGCHAALLVAGSPADDDLVVLVSFVGVILPEGPVADADGIDMGIEGDEVSARSDETEDVPHGVDLHPVVPAGLHLRPDPGNHFLLPAALAGKSDHVPKKTGYFRSVLFRLAQYLLEGNHGIPSFIQ